MKIELKEYIEKVIDALKPSETNVVKFNINIFVDKDGKVLVDSTDQSLNTIDFEVIVK